MRASSACLTSSALGPVGRQQHDLGVSAVGIRDKNRGDAPARHRLAENQVAVGEKQANVLDAQREIADAVAFVPVEAVLANRARDVTGRPGRDRRRK